MRPRRLDLEGFASFRDPVTVDFTDADLFVLSGPTGAGKSSLVDAMILALYGTVPRYDDRRVVAPAISQGKAEARVRLDFTVGDRHFTAARVIRRTATGATTKEARLEAWRDPQGTQRTTLAGTAEEVTTRVATLLGLKFEHFTSCIVLPQGAFQHFLHARPKDRQDLLVQLLDLSVFRQVGRAARERAMTGTQRLDGLQARLDGDLATATPQAVAEVAARIEELETLLAEIDAAQPGLDAVRAQGAALREAATQAQQRVDLLAALAPPDGLDDIVAARQRAQRDLESTEATLEAAGAAIEQATAARTAAGDPTPWSRQLERLADRARLRRDRDKASGTAKDAADRLVEAEHRVAATTNALGEARQQLQTAQHDDLVGTLLVDHAAGDPCPVCDRPLDQLPSTPGSDVLAHARTLLTQAETSHATATAARLDADRDATRAQAEADHLTQRAHELDTAIAHADLPDDDAEVKAHLAAISAHDEHLQAARATETRARQAHRDARQTMADVDARHRRLDDALTRTHAHLAELAPPPRRDDDDLGRSWQRLMAWKHQQHPGVAAAAADAAAAVTDAADEWKRQTAQLRRRCAAVEVRLPEGATPRDAVVGDLARARARHERLADQLQEAGRVRQDITAARRDVQVATTLGTHLRSSHFEKWLLGRALTLLVRGATATLRELSAGAYSLTLDDHGGFAVIDHRNADDVRSARTLSGGETFLASLALALALSEHVADLAARGAARLECLILDEGFGTLDAETLDVVASALEELGSRGRMIGVITHVEALAERLPVRFDVRKRAGASQVVRR